MEKSYLRRPLAALLSLLMVIGMFTVCGFGVLADGETVGVTLKTWSVDELDAAAQATGTKNYLDGPIYHKTIISSVLRGWIPRRTETGSSIRRE